MSGKSWKEIFNQETSVGGGLVFDAPNDDWDAYLAVCETKTAAGTSLALNALLEDGSNITLSSIVTPPVGTQMRLSVGKDIETDNFSGAIEQMPAFCRFRWTINSGVGGTIRLRVYGINGA